MSTGGAGDRRREPAGPPSPGPPGLPRRIVVEFDPGDPPSGRLVREGAATDEFIGRLELYAALERARAVESCDRPLPDDPRSTTEKGP